MKTSIYSLCLFLIAVTGFGAAGNQIQKPQNEIVMSGEAQIPGWGMTGMTVTNAIRKYRGLDPTYVFDMGRYTLSNNVTFAANEKVIMAPASSFWVGTNKVLTFEGTMFYADNLPIFEGPGTVTGCISVIVSLDDGQWNGVWTNGFTGLYYLTNCAALIGGDDIADNSIGGNHIIDGSITGDDIATNSIPWNRLEEDPRTNNLAFDYYAKWSNTNRYATLTLFDGDLDEGESMAFPSNATLTTVFGADHMMDLVGFQWKFTPAYGQNYLIDLSIDTWSRSDDDTFFTGIGCGLSFNGGGSNLNSALHAAGYSDTCFEDGDIAQRSSSFLRVNVTGDGTNYYRPFLAVPENAEGNVLVNINEFTITITEVP